METRKSMERPQIAHPKTSVLRHAALGDVQLAHDLDTRDDGGVVLLGDGLHGLLQHAVDAVLDDHGVVARLDVNIAGAPLQGGKDGGVHQADDGADVGLGRQLLDRDGLVGVLVLDNDVEGEAFAGFFQHALRLLRLLQDVADLRQAGDLGGDAPAQQQADLVDHHQLAGIGDGDHQPAVGLVLQRHEVVAEHQVHRDLAEQFVLDVEVLQVHKLATIALRQFFAVLDFVLGARRTSVAAGYEYWFLSSAMIIPFSP